MLQLAGGVADGVILNSIAAARRAHPARQDVSSGEPRSPDEIRPTIIAASVIWVSRKTSGMRHRQRRRTSSSTWGIRKLTPSWSNPGSWRTGAKCRR